MSGLDLFAEERRGIALRKKYDLHYFSGDCCNENVRLEIQELFIQVENLEI